MTEFTLSIFEPNSLLPHRAGIAGLALALSAISQNDALVSGIVCEDCVQLNWICTDREAIQWLLEHTYQINDGYLKVPALDLDEQGAYTFTAGVTSTFLQHSKQRKQEKNTTTLSFQIDDGQPEINISYRPLLDCYYTSDFKEAFNSKGAFKPAIPLKGHHLPGLVECFANGAYKESPEGYLALLFLPLACHYYQLPRYRSAIAIPAVTDLVKWVEQRQRLSGKTVQKLSSDQYKLLKRSYRNYRTTSAAESALALLLQERLIEDNQDFRVNYCEVYQLGKQPWDGNQSYLKQAVHRVYATDRTLKVYQSAYYLFPAKVRKNEKGETWLAISKVLPWISENLVKNDVWYSGFFEFCKVNEIYERKGLINMTDRYLEEDEQVLFDAVQSSFRRYRSKQYQIRREQLGRDLTQEDRNVVAAKCTEKTVNKFQSPNTQTDFAAALVKFLSDYPTSALQSKGPQIFHWLHRQANWKQARDLSLLAVITYQGKAFQNAEKGEQEAKNEDKQKSELNAISI